MKRAPLDYDFIPHGADGCCFHFLALRDSMPGWRTVSIPSDKEHRYQAAAPLPAGEALLLGWVVAQVSASTPPESQSHQL